MHHYKHLPENVKMYENMPKTGISLSENTIIFHYEAYYSVQRMIVSLVPLNKCSKDQK